MKTQISRKNFHPEKRYSGVELLNPDFAKLAGAYGIPARRVLETKDVVPAIDFARETEGPVLVEFVVEKEEIVYPMVPAGADLDDMLRRPQRRSAVAGD